MGEVYRAEDTRLGREVAIKVLPEAFTADPERLARFEREARVLASLSHPNIAQIYEVGAVEATSDLQEPEGLEPPGRPLHFLVMELAHGETLATRIARGPLPVDEALPIALQIAEALEAAHERGVIHRDLKPANVMVDREGRVKLLDFGLARALEPEPDAAAAELTHSPTLSHQATRAGVLLGTAAYMSPEQARGQAAGSQADLWSFGVVLWEMLTGRRLFDGETVSDTLAAVLRQDVDTGELPAETPIRVRRTLDLCLQRDPRHRLRHAGDAVLLLTAGEEAPAPGEVKARGRVARWLPWAATVVALAALLLAGLWWREHAAPRTRLVITEVTAPSGTSLRLGRGLALSPDGRHLVVAAADESGQTRLWLRTLATTAARPLAGTEEAVFPFWSPDSRHIAFFAEHRLKRIAVAGGPAQSLCDVRDPRGGSWSDSGEIVFASHWRGGLEIIPATGGPRRVLTTLDADRGEISHRWPWFLPGGRAVLFLAQTGEGELGHDSTLEYLDLASGARTTLVQANSSLAYSPTGHLLYWRNGSLVAQPFDLASRRMTGDYVPVAESVQYTLLELAVFAISSEGTLVYGPSSGADVSQIVQVDLEGNRLGELTTVGAYYDAAFSPDGERLAYRLGDDLWIHDLTRGSASRFTFEEGPVLMGPWSPDGAWLAYVSQGEGNTTTILRKLSSGLGEPEELLRVDEAAELAGWSRDGGQLVFMRFTPGTYFDLWTLDLETRRAEPLLATPFFEGWPSYSPDGRWLAYCSNERGPFDVYVRAVGEPGGRWQVSPAGGEQPKWAPDGRTLYYLSDTGSVMAVPVEPGDTFRPGQTVELFATPVRVGDENTDYDLHPDGRSFLINWPVGTTEQRAVLVLDWPRLLNRRP